MKIDNLYLQYRCVLVFFTFFVVFLITSDQSYSRTYFNSNKAIRNYKHSSLRSEPIDPEPISFKILNATSSDQLETRVQFTSQSQKNISGSLTWKVLDSLNGVIQSVTRPVLIPSISKKKLNAEVFTLILPKGIYRVICLFQNKLLHIKQVHETYYSTINQIDIPVQDALAPKINFVIPDLYKNVSPQNQHLQGFIKDHLKVYLHARFNTVNGKALLTEEAAGIEKNGTFTISLGKYLADASLVWKFTQDAQLKKQIDSIAYAFSHTQETDGFMGIRSSPSVWVQEDIITLRNNIQGLLMYYQTTGYVPALNSCIAAGNLVNKTFNSKTGLTALFSIGKLASSSIIDPMVDLYVQTGEPKYLSFCQNLLIEMEMPGEPKLISSLTTEGKFDLTDTRMEDVLANLTAILKLYRITGSNAYLNPCTAAWEGIVNDPALLSISTIREENLDALNLWTQFNAQFALSTGEVSYFNQVDKAVYLSKSSAILPYYPIGVMDNHPVIINYETGNFKEEILTYDGKNTSLSVSQSSNYPQDGKVSLIINPAKNASFTLSLRRPARSIYYRATIAGKVYTVQPNHFLNIQRFWKQGDQIDIQFEMLPNYVTNSQETDAYQKEETQQNAADKTIKIKHQIRRSW